MDEPPVGKGRLCTVVDGGRGSYLRYVLPNLPLVWLVMQVFVSEAPVVVTYVSRHEPPFFMRHCPFSAR